LKEHNNTGDVNKGISCKNKLHTIIGAGIRGLGYWTV
jgi:hypothetical protein